MSDVDPTLLPLPELRSMRASLQQQEDAVSYVRRIAQVRLDMVLAEIESRAGAAGAATTDANGQLGSILGSHLTGAAGSARPPRPAVDASNHPLAVALEQLWADLGGTALDGLDDAQLRVLRDAVHEFEQARSNERRELFGRIDALSGELVRRYREGEADVDGLLGDE